MSTSETYIAEFSVQTDADDIEKKVAVCMGTHEQRLLFGYMASILEGLQEKDASELRSATDSLRRYLNDIVILRIAPNLGGLDEFSSDIRNMDRFVDPTGNRDLFYHSFGHILNTVIDKPEVIPYAAKILREKGDRPIFG